MNSKFFKFLNEHIKIFQLIAIVFSFMIITNLYIKYDTAKTMAEYRFDKPATLVVDDEQARNADIFNGTYLFVNFSDLDRDLFPATYMCDGRIFEIGLDQTNIRLHEERVYHEYATFDVSNGFDADKSFQQNIDDGNIHIDLYYSPKITSIHQHQRIQTSSI